MIKQDYITDYKNGVEYLSEAHEELCKPQEDVVNFVVCKNSYKAVYHFLKSFLLYNKVEIPFEETLENLFHECKKIEPRFNELKLEVLYHPMEKEDVWMDHETCHTFMNHAKQTKRLVESLKASGSY